MKTQKYSKRNEVDPDFGTNGQITIDVPGSQTTAMRSLTRDILGATFVYGVYSETGGIHDSPDQEISPYRMAVCKLTGNELDPNFGTDGFVFQPEGEVRASLAGFGLQSNENFFVSGPLLNHVTLIHYDRRGEHISTVDISTPPFNGAPPTLMIIKAGNDALLNDKVLMTRTVAEGAAIYRRNADGSQDTEFGNNGEVVYLPGEPFERPIASLISQGSGSASDKFYVAGRYKNEAYFARMDMAGNLDTEFAEGGIYFYRYFTDPGERSVATIQPLGNGGLLALIYSSSQGTSFIIKLTARGVLDSTFHDGNPMHAPGIQDVALQADGKLLVTQRRYFDALNDSALARYSSDGELDLSFGEDGAVVLKDMDVESVIAQPDGQYIVSGNITVQGRQITVLRRVTADA